MPKSKRAIFALTQAYVEMLHDDLVSVIWPVTDPIALHEYRDIHLLSSATARPFQSAFGQDVYSGIFEKGAALFHSLIASHPFHNGNKRTAILALDHFLLANGFFLALSNNHMYKLAMNTATYKERGIGHDAILSQIEETLRSGSLPLSDLEKKGDRSSLYENVNRVRSIIRRHKLNRRMQ